MRCIHESVVPAGRDFRRPQCSGDYSLRCGPTRPEYNSFNPYRKYTELSENTQLSRFRLQRIHSHRKELPAKSYRKPFLGFHSHNSQARLLKEASELVIFPGTRSVPIARLALHVDLTL